MRFYKITEISNPLRRTQFEIFPNKRVQNFVIISHNFARNFMKSIIEYENQNLITLLGNGSKNNITNA